MLARILCILLAFPFVALAQESGSDPRAELAKLNWQEGPSKGAVGAKATIEVPAGYVFLGERDTSRFIELVGNPPPRQSHYLVAPKSLAWFAVFSFDETGYIKDDEKIDPEALMKSLKEGDGPQNDERKRLGMRAMYTDGWAVAPHYDTETKRLEWGVRLKSEDGRMNVNYTSRILGRTGVMRAVLVSDVETLDKDTKEFKAALQRFAYNPGETYAEFKQGDKVAEYGLAALILGGAAAVATKKGFWGAIAGFFAAFWKVIAAVAVAAIAGLRSFFKKKSQ